MSTFEGKVLYSHYLSHKHEGDIGTAKYLMANLALHNLVTATKNGAYPSDKEFGYVVEQFEKSITANENDPLNRFRSQQIRALVKPIVWADIINLGGLSDREAVNVAVSIDLHEAVDQTAVVLDEAIQEYDSLKSVTLASRTDRQEENLGRTRGFINEATPTQLSGRHTTAKMIVLPSMAYDDRYATEKVDGFLYDNRVKRGQKRYSYQVKSADGVQPKGGLSLVTVTPVLHARDMGNLSKQSIWPHDDREFVTARMVVEERLHGSVTDETSSKLDHIGANVLNIISRGRATK